MKYFAAIGIAVLLIAAASVGPWAPSPFTARTGTNTTAAAWRDALSAPSAASLTTVSNAQVTTAANLLTVSNAQVTTDGKLTGYVTNLGGFATNAALTGGTVTSVTNLDLTASRVMLSDANKVPTSSSVTATTLGYLDATSSVQTQIDSKPTVALTNVALLSGTNVFTGTNTFTAEKFFPANGIGLRFLAVTNLPVLSFYDAATNSSVPYTNGGFSVCTPVVSIPVQACVGSNSAVGVSLVYYKTNATPSAGELHAWAGTNYISRLAAITASATVQRFIFGGAAFNNAGNLFKNFGSFTNQIPATRDGNDTGVDAPFTIVDSGSPWTLNIGFTSTSGATNVAFVRFEVFEFAIP